MSEMSEQCQSIDRLVGCAVELQDRYGRMMAVGQLVNDGESDYAVIDQYKQLAGFRGSDVFDWDAEFSIIVLNH